MFENKLASPDDFYETLLEAHQGLSLAQSHVLNARLVLILANEVGALSTIRAALHVARDGLGVATAVPAASEAGAGSTTKNDPRPGP